MSKLKIKILADRDHLIQKGLMFTESLPSDECAFFVFPRAAKHAFWNKNVPYSIDVGFYDNGGKLIHVGALEAEQTQPIMPCDDAKYVLEANRGWFDTHEIKVGSNLWDVLDLEK